MKWFKKKGKVSEELVLFDNLTQLDYCRIGLNKIMDAMSTKPNMNSDEKCVVQTTKNALLSAYPDVDWWWK